MENKYIVSCPCHFGEKNSHHLETLQICSFLQTIEEAALFPSSFLARGVVGNSCVRTILYLEFMITQLRTRLRVNGEHRNEYRVPVGFRLVAAFHCGIFN